MPLNPIDQLKLWLKAAQAAEVLEPTAMILATATCAGRPSARTVLLKGIDERGLVFYTHYTSRKSNNLKENPHVSTVFLWKEVNRQIIVEGNVHQVPAAESDAYFASRPRGSQIGCWASNQGQEITSREELEQTIVATEKRFDGRQVPRPPHWGGWRIVPHRFEFWEGRTHRLHDRLEYVLTNDAWKERRLSP